MKKKKDEEEYFNVNDVELRSEEVQEVLGDVPHWILRWGILLLAVFLLVLFVGSYFFKYPEIISSQLTLTTTNPPANIVAKTNGKISHIFVDDGANVEKNQILGVIENSANFNDVFYLDSVLESVSNAIKKEETYYFHSKELMLGELQSSFSNLLIQLDSYNNFMSLNYYPRKIESIKSVLEIRKKLLATNVQQKQIVQEQHKLEKKSYEREKILKSKNIIADESFETAVNKYLQSVRSVNSMNSSVEAMQVEILQLQESLVDLEQQYAEKKNNFDVILKSIINQLQNDILGWRMNYLLSTPIEGKVTFTEIWAVNQNVIGGKTVFTVVPNTTTGLVGKAELPIERSGKVKIGQSVNVRFNNYPENQYGIVKGVVKNISLIPTDEGKYIVEVRFPNKLKTSYGEELPLFQEMTARADIITEDTRLLEQFLFPLKNILRNQ